MILFGGLDNLELTVSTISVFLLGMGIIDALSALYSSVKKRGWFTSVVDALVDVAAALGLLFCARGDLVMGLLVVAIYTFVSGLIDIFHGFLSTVDPTDRFIRVLAGIIGCVMGFVILNAGSFEVMTFIRFFGAYMLVVGVTSLIYGVHNRSQKIEDSIARSESRKKKSAFGSSIRLAAGEVSGGVAKKSAKSAKTAKSTKKSSSKKSPAKKAKK
ncbi:DUF308 domain-containing protein [Candidatus Saccharibacteria bacterium]|nr:DUF308 domain-containing protein [Candidatus Saccharibacteria bacterium]